MKFNKKSKKYGKKLRNYSTVVQFVNFYFKISL